MADVFAQLDQPKTGVLCDLSPTTMSPWYLLRDTSGEPTFSYARGQVQRVMSEQPGRYGGQKMLRETRDNDTVGATWVVAGTSEADCLQNAHTLFAAFERESGAAGAGLTQLYLRWSPDGSSVNYDFAQQGSADWGLHYDWAAYKGALVLRISATWQVSPFDFSTITFA